MSIRKGGQVIAGTPNITTGHHVGEIFWTSRLDNELNGAVDADGAVYSVEAFIGEQSVPALLRKGSLPFVSMTEYESIVSSNGSCRAWGWDNGDTFRVPTLKDVYLMAGQAETAGEFISESLPDHNHIEGFCGVNTVAAYGVTNTATAGNINQQSGSSTANHAYTSKASEYSSVYQNNAKVRPDSVRYRAMVQLSTGVKEDATQLKEYKFNNPHFFGESKWTDVEPKNSSWLVSNGVYHSGRTYVGYYQWLLKIHNGTETVDGVSVKGVSDEYTDYDWVVNTADETFRLPLLNGGEDWVGSTSQTISTANIVSGSPFVWTASQNGFIKFTCYASTTQVVVAQINGQVINHVGAGVPTTITPRPGFWLKVKKRDAVRLSAESGTLQNVGISFIPATGNGSLYFYVGDTLQDTNLIQTGEILDYFSKIHTVHCVVETFKSGSSWYRVYDDGWIEQGGIAATVSADGHACTITFLKPFLDTGYVFLKTNQTTSNVTDVLFTGTYSSKTTTSIKIYNFSSYVSEASWFACGYGA